MAVAAETSPPMPDLASSTHGFHHTIDSAVETLARLGVPQSRITVEIEGPGGRAHQVLHQEPPPGARLTPEVRITLKAVDVGFFHSLPAGMRDAGGDREPGTRELVSLFDDPLAKAGYWVRRGGRLFDITRENSEACSRWVSLFGLDPHDWPRENLYSLALLLPLLERVAGSEEGIRLALRVILGLPLRRIQREAAFTSLEDEDLTRLAARNSRLGADVVLGDHAEDLEALILEIGPVSLDVYYEFQQEEAARRLESLARLVTPWHQRCYLDWLVLDPGRAPRLGIEAENSRLGINTHLGVA